MDANARAIQGRKDRRMSDTIRRQAAIDALRYAQHRFTVADEAGGMGTVKWSEDVIYFAAAERVLAELPSADRPQGEWIEQEDDYHHYWECSECGMGVGLDDIRNYCPNCGARMKGADDE